MTNTGTWGEDIWKLLQTTVLDENPHKKNYNLQRIQMCTAKNCCERNWGCVMKINAPFKREMSLLPQPRWNKLSMLPAQYTITHLIWKKKKITRQSSGPARLHSHIFCFTNVVLTLKVYLLMSKCGRIIKKYQQTLTMNGYVPTVLYMSLVYTKIYSIKHSNFVPTVPDLKTQCCSFFSNKWVSKSTTTM